MPQTGRDRTPALAGAVTLLMLLAACSAPPAPPPVPAPQQSESQPTAAPPAATGTGRVVIVTRDEPVSLDTRLFRSHEVQSMVNAPIAYHDEADVVRPLLAEKMPSRDDGSWTIEDDGSMVTIYKLKPNLKWQDGRPLDAFDFVFAFGVYIDRNVPVLKRAPEQYMISVSAPDSQTVR